MVAAWQRGVPGRPTRSSPTCARASPTTPNEAERDLADIVHYIASHDEPSEAHHVLRRLEDLCASLAALPSRGHCPPELERLGITAYREVPFKPYRVIYEVIERDVVIHAILDGRRDMQALLERRMLR